MNDQNIYPLKGYGGILFGMTTNQVEKILGHDHPYEDWMGGNIENFLLYPGLIIEMVGHPLKFGVRVKSLIFKDHEEAKLFGKRFRDWKLNELIKYLNQEQILYTQKNKHDFEIESLKMDIGFNNVYPFELIDLEIRK